MQHKGFIVGAIVGLSFGIGGMYFSGTSADKVETTDATVASQSPSSCEGSLLDCQLKSLPMARENEQLAKENQALHKSIDRRNLQFAYDASTDELCATPSVGQITAQEFFSIDKRLQNVLENITFRDVMKNADEQYRTIKVCLIDAQKDDLYIDALGVFTGDADRLAGRYDGEQLTVGYYESSPGGDVSSCRATDLASKSLFFSCHNGDGPATWTVNYALRPSGEVDELSRKTDNTDSL